MTEENESTMKDQKYKGYPLFNNVVDKNLQAWNRAAIMHNMCNDGNEELVNGYANTLDEAGKMSCLVVMQAILTNGLEQTRNDLLGNVTLQ